MTKNETWGGLRQFPVAGHYFELMNTVNPVDVVLYAGDGRVIHDEKQVEEGYYVDRRGLEPFTRIEITTGASEAVKFMYSDALSGQKSALSDVTDRAARLLGIVYGSLGQVVQVAIDGVNSLAVVCAGTLGRVAQAAIGGVNALVSTERGFAYGAAFGSTTGLAAATNETVLAPASNINGVMVWAADISTSHGTAASATTVGLIAKSSAPASAVDGDVLLNVSVFMQTAAGLGAGHARLERPVFVAAGKGIYFRNSGGVTEAAPYRNVLYTVL